MASHKELATRPVLLMLALALACAGASVGRTQDEHLGITEYELACMACHGVDGRGDGPLAKTLKARPADLTQISKANGAQTIIAAIKETPSEMPIDIVLHTPGGLVLAAMQIARAVEAHPAKVTVYVPVYAMSGGTLIALAADEIVLGEFSVLGPIDPQIAGLPAASIIRARDSKPIEHVFDLTLVLADVSEKALAQVKRGAVELLTPRLDQAAAEALASKLAGGHWTHDYALIADEARQLGLPVKVGMPREVLELMKLYPQPVQRSGVEFLPIDVPTKRAASILAMWTR